MIKTQVQIPDQLYQDAKRLAKQREMSFAEVVRRGLEYMTAVYPAHLSDKKWTLPQPQQRGWKGLTSKELRELATETTTESHLKLHKRHVVR